MNVEYHSFYSSKLGREMAFKRYGHAGKPMIAFPSSGGRFYEYEDFKMVEACAPLIEAGLVQIFTPDSIDNETWLNKSQWAGDMARHHDAFDAYITEEFVPFIADYIQYAGGFIATGCSMGGYHSVNFFFRHPDLFDTLIALSGIYDARFFVGENIGDVQVYLNSPVDYLSNLEDNAYLDAYRNNTIIICTGQGAWEEDSIRDTRRMEAVLQAKNIPAWIDYWGYDVDHDWPWWRVQIAYYLGKLNEWGKL